MAKRLNECCSGHQGTATWKHVADVSHYEWNGRTRHEVREIDVSSKNPEKLTKILKHAGYKKHGKQVDNCDVWKSGSTTEHVRVVIMLRQYEHAKK